MKIKIHVEKYRIEKGLSFSELVRHSGVSKTNLHKIVAGERRPTVETICKLAIAL
ncbi:MAG: helix-turn-helix domain-containing protein [Oscillospiraceae bacterium]|jgi:transcriptional regulator with XRE-family HTH domain|nr:helix-turn-helix domain-containing protein [Oscillospiraceae bacterium]